MNYNRKKENIISYNENGNIEDIQEVERITKIEKRHFRKGTFFTMNKLISKVVLQKKYTGETFRVLFLLLDMIDFNNRIQSFTQKDLAEKLNTSQPNISKALKVLSDDNIIYKKNRDWYFSDEFVKFAGDTK